MNTLSAQEIKRRGISAVDKSLKSGAVHIIKNNQPLYVVLSEKQYNELIQSEESAYLKRLKTSLNEVHAGKINTYKSAASLIKKMGLDD